MVFVLDNYDSFTYNLVQYLGELGQQVEIRRNDQITPQEIEALNPDHIVVSPGPCTPQKAGISIELIKYFAGKRPVLGVCLGHQAIGAAFGGNVVRAHQIMHGKTSAIKHDGKTLFQNAPQPMTATRYHSLIVAEEGLPKELEISAETREADGTRVITSTEALALEFVPKAMLILGAGAVGVEFASIYNSFGSKVTILEALPRVVPVEDEEVSKALDKSFKKAGMKIYVNSEVTKVDTSGAGCVATVKTPDGEIKIEADIVLSAVGVATNLEGIGLEERIKVPVNPTKRIG